MAFVNLKEKEIQVKSVYSGPGQGGKTGNLENSHHKFASRINTERSPSKLMVTAIYRSKPDKIQHNPQTGSTRDGRYRLKKIW